MNAPYPLPVKYLVLGLQAKLGLTGEKGPGAPSSYHVPSIALGAEDSKKDPVPDVTEPGSLVRSSASQMLRHQDVQQRKELSTRQPSKKMRE